MKAGLMAVGFEDQLYVDEQGTIRDSQIENLFDDCFYGRELDETFRHNFKEYSHLLIGEGCAPPDDVFDNVIKLLEWACPHFGSISVGPAPPSTVAGTPSLREAGATHRAVFDEPQRFRIAPCYAPSELHAVLLCLVSAFRATSVKHSERTFKSPSNMTH